MCAVMWQWMQHQLMILRNCPRLTNIGAGEPPGQWAGTHVSHWISNPRDQLGHPSGRVEKGNPGSLIPGPQGNGQGGVSKEITRSRGLCRRDPVWASEADFPEAKDWSRDGHAPVFSPVGSRCTQWPGRDSVVPPQPGHMRASTTAVPLTTWP